MTKKTSKSQQSSTAKAVTTPQAPEFLKGPATDYYAKIQGLMNAPMPQVYGVSPLQQNAFNAAGNMGPNAGINDALAAIRGLGGNGVTAGQLAETDLSPYMNRYENDVINATVGDWSHANELGLNQLNSNATRSGGAFGSRAAVAQGQFMGDQTRSLASLLANLRAGNFAQAQQGAQFDIGNRLGADQFNANYRLGAANDLLQGGLGADASRRADIGVQSGLGDTQRQVSQESDPTFARAQWLANLQSLLGGSLDPSNYTGQKVDSSGTSTSKTTESGSGLDMLGQLLSIGLGAKKLIPSDRRLKRDITHRHTDANGLKWYTFKYLWDDAEHYGVMADEAPPEAVVMHPSGYAMVDYSKLEAR